jgi:hypothetical protein
MEYRSLKAIVCQNFAQAPTTEILSKNQVCFLTPMGVVSGTVMPPVEKSDTLSEEQRDRAAEIVTREIVKESIKMLDEMLKDPNVERPAKDSLIMLENAQIRSVDLSTSFTVKSLILFTDQILGVFLGDL